MTQLYASVATGTAATLMAITLLLLRLNLKGRRPGRRVHEALGCDRHPQVLVLFWL